MDATPLFRWQPQALCGQLVAKGEAELWWWNPNKGQAPHAKEKAIPICNRCPVIEPCREWAMSRDEWGTWGGLTCGQRKNGFRTATCKVCGDDFRYARSRQVTMCSDECRKAAKRDSNRDSMRRRREAAAA
jgi:WhiB family redox-sensing transcriptional regulator